MDDRVLSNGAGVTEERAALDAVLRAPDVARLARHVRVHPGRTIDAYQDSSFAAIALVIRLGENERPELLLIKRAEYEGDPWSGHIACPGGRMEAIDEDLERTAIRETREEIGIDLAHDGRVIGTLDDVAPRTPVLPPIIIRPYVAVVVPRVFIVTSEEVADTFWVPLEVLRRPESSGTGVVRVRGIAREVPRPSRGGERCLGPHGARSAPDG